jgi:hypothetical protein
MHFQYVFQWEWKTKVWDVESKTSGVIFLFCGMPKVVVYINRSSRAAAGAS